MTTISMEELQNRMTNGAGRTPFRTEFNREFVQSLEVNKPKLYDTSDFKTGVEGARTGISSVARSLNIRVSTHKTLNPETGEHELYVVRHETPQAVRTSALYKKV